MPTIRITTRSGAGREIDAELNRSLMEIIRDNGFAELSALCGGCCSCATCHVYIGREHASLLSAMTLDEDALLDASSHRKEGSRLSCQLNISASLDGLQVTIAPED